MQTWEKCICTEKFGKIAGFGRDQTQRLDVVSSNSESLFKSLSTSRKSNVKLTKDASFHLQNAINLLNDIESRLIPYPKMDIRNKAYNTIDHSRTM